MKKKTTLLLFLLILSIYTLNINVQSAEENDNRPTSLELTTHDPIEILSDSDFEVFPGAGTAEDPYLIDGYDITTTEECGIYITDTTKYFIVRNCYVEAVVYGIYINNVADGTTTVINNTCSNNDYGICLHNSGSSTVANNTCNNNEYGIYLRSSGSYTVTNNTCNNNEYGIHLSYSGSSTVENNKCNNNNIGIGLYNSDFCVVTYNLLKENEGYGVYSSSSFDNNLFHHNTFVDNNLGGTSQAYDDGTNNLWYDSATQEGNYWSDWSGTGSYSIDGSASSEDSYPLDEPAVEYSTDENPLNFTFTLLMLVVSLILKRIISKKTKK